MPSYLCGIDIGGTFTDCVLIDEHGGVTTTKAPSTPGNFARGMMAALDLGAKARGVSLAELCASIGRLSHGTTVGTNAIIQKRGVKVGLITTKGHNDVIHIMRGSRGLTGADIKQVVHIPESKKPDPIVPKSFVEGVSERVDCFGKVVVPLNEAEAEAAIRSLVDKGVKAIAVCFLWSFLEPTHERRVKEMIERIAPGVFVTTSVDLVPKWGEYERTAAVALNAYIGPLVTGYLAGVAGDVKGLGYHHPLQITQCGGGTISVSRAMGAPLLTLDSGPVAGVMGSAYAGGLMGYPNVITTDMGGTSFDVGVIHNGTPGFSYRSLVHQYEYYLAKVDVQTVGAGGGSLVRVDPSSGVLKVGPESAGAEPGPICYRRGGTVPTVTDADVVLGYLDPDNFAGGSMSLDKAAAEAGIRKVGEQIGMSVLECASGVAKIVEFQMADLIRKVTVRKGLDPRDFVLFAFGGAGPVHAGVFARELGVAKVIVPQKEMASVWCAFGAAAADVLHLYEQVEIMRSPFDAQRMDRVLQALKAKADADLDEDGADPKSRDYRFSIDMRHKGQINEVEVVLTGRGLKAGDIEALHADFFRRYEALYGKGASLPGAPLEAVTFRCRARVEVPKPKLLPTDKLTAEIPMAARRKPRQIYWAEWGRLAETPIFDGHALLPGNRITGPCVAETRDTSVVVHPGETLTVDRFGNFEILLSGA